RWKNSRAQRTAGYDRDAALPPFRVRGREAGMSRDAVEKRIGVFVGRYAPHLAATLKACRARLRDSFPRGVELIYDNYNALVFGFAPSARASEAVVSIAAYPRWVTLFFLDGARLPDPEALLQGDGKRVRSVRLQSAADFERAAIRQLLRQAAAQAP